MGDAPSRRCWRGGNALSANYASFRISRREIGGRFLGDGRLSANAYWVVLDGAAATSTKTGDLIAWLRDAQAKEGATGDNLEQLVGRFMRPHLERRVAA